MKIEPASPILTVGVYRTIRGITRTEWDACFPGDPEGWAYYLAVEESGLAAFSWVYLVAREGERIVAVVPAFITEYSLDTTVQGRWKLALQPLLRRLRRGFTLRLLCLGSPFADKCHLGFAPDLPSSRRGEAVSRLLTSLDAFAAGQAIGLLAAKDLSDADLPAVVRAALAAAGFSSQPSLPNAVLALPHASEELYLKSLSHAARRDVRRKLRSRDLVRVELRRGPEALELVPELVRLYDAQRSRSSLDFDQFESLTQAYFLNVLAEKTMAAVVFLYLHQDRLVAFNLCYHTDRMFIDKFIGFELPLARSLNLYVVSWMTNVRYCIERGIPFLQTGQTGYRMKCRLGSKLQPNRIFYRHRNPIVNFILRRAGPLLAADRHDDDLKARSGGAP